jgi:anti-sigma regulatory factor (Ser/Thr protein kinase)
VIASKRFAMSAASVAKARHFVRQVLGHCPGSTVDTAELLTSELATNAVLHGHTSFDVSVSHGSGVLRVAVSDGNDLHPSVLTPDHHALHGRGMRLVEHLADSWGSVGQHPGKTVWFDIMDVRTAPDAGGSVTGAAVLVPAGRGGGAVAAGSARRDPPGAGPAPTGPQRHQIDPGPEGVGRAAHRLHRQ